MKDSYTKLNVSATFSVTLVNFNWEFVFKMNGYPYTELFMLEHNNNKNVSAYFSPNKLNGFCHRQKVILISSANFMTFLYQTFRKWDGRTFWIVDISQVAQCGFDDNHDFQAFYKENHFLLGEQTFHKSTGNIHKSRQLFLWVFRHSFPSNNRNVSSFFVISSDLLYCWRDLWLSPDERLNLCVGLIFHYWM